MTDNSTVLADTLQGKVEGIYENGQYAFKAIPYAEPPVGNNRWLPPQPAGPWEGIRPAKEYGSISPQNEMPAAAMPSKLLMNEPQDENCLFLNIWTPGIDHAGRPVMVWIHGGAFIIGSGSQEMFRANTLVSNGDIVLVSINYRLGALGFMNLKEITGGKIPATGCEGLLDQIAAVDWVQKNIQNFGGDPDNITLFGESAGGMSIGCLMAMPAARGRFHKCILQSGAANTVGSLDESTASTEQFLDILGLSPDSTDEIRALSTAQILSAQEKLGIIMHDRDNRITPFQPVVDGIVMPEIPINAIKNGSAAGVHTLIGTNLEEFKLFSLMDPGLRNIDESRMIQRMEGLIPPEHVPTVVAEYTEARRARGESTNPAEILEAVQGDFMFRIPALNLVAAQQSNHQPVFNYLFNWKSPVLNGALGACHALEIGFVFGNYDNSFCGSGPDADALSRKIQDAWVAFARTGNPSCESLGKWVPYGENRTTMLLGRACRLENAPNERERRAWDAFDILITKPI
jgi:para-nitrobenzyl esterase